MATISDVAKEAGLAVATVSRIMNNRGYISEEARRKVEAAAEKLNYRPNELARSLSKQKNNTIGIIVPHIEHPYFAKLISNIEKAASDRKYKILLCNTREEHEREQEYLDMCVSNRLMGVILGSPVLEPEALIKLNIPIITIERYLGQGTASIVCDNFQGGVMAANHLIDRGCRYLINFGGVENNSMPADEREEGFLRTCEQRNVIGLSVKSKANEYYMMEYHDYIEKILKEHPEVDGIFASSDIIADQVIQVCTRLEIGIPDKMKLVGFDDVNVAALTTPTITTIRQPVKEIADMAVDLLIKSAQGEVIPTKVMLPVKLIVREST